MKLRPNERQEISDILQEEIKQATQRIADRLVEYECQPASTKEDQMDGIRRFYSDLADKDWTEADEKALAGYADMGESELKEMMREAFRRSMLHPVPSFASLIKTLKSDSLDAGSQPAGSLNNTDAVPQVERERIANMLHQDLVEAADEISRRLKLADTKASIVREQLEIAEGAIIARFTPLV